MECRCIIFIIMARMNESTRTPNRRTLKKAGGAAFVSFMMDHILIIHNETKAYAIFIVVVRT